MVEPVKGYVTSDGSFFKDQKTADLIEAAKSLKKIMGDASYITTLMRNADRVVAALRPIVQYAKDEQKVRQEVSEQDEARSRWDANDSIGAIIGNNWRR